MERFIYITENFTGSLFPRKLTRKIYTICITFGIPDFIKKGRRQKAEGINSFTEMPEP